MIYKIFSNDSCTESLSEIIFDDENVAKWYADNVIRASNYFVSNVRLFTIQDRWKLTLPESVKELIGYFEEVPMLFGAAITYQRIPVKYSVELLKAFEKALFDLKGEKNANNFKVGMYEFFYEPEENMFVMVVGTKPTFWK